MNRLRKKNIIITGVIILTLIGIIIPIHAYGKVKPITAVEDTLEGISEEEKSVLKELFSINQKITELEAEAEKINKEISSLKQQMKDLEEKIDEKQKDYDSQLSILKQVLVKYQRGGPSTYLEGLLGAKKLSSFLKSMNAIKDISHNVNDLLVDLEAGKKVLQEQNQKLKEKDAALEIKQLELTENLNKNVTLQKEKETYLASLQEEKAYYAEQLGNLQTMWENCQSLFPKLAKEITDTINEGYFTFDDLNMGSGFLNMKGYIEEDTFNGILSENSELANTQFGFEENQVILSVPKEHLVLIGNFIISGKSAIKFEVMSGTFYDMPLEKASIEELFAKGPMLIDFGLISKGIITIEFTLNEVESKEKKLTFEVSPKW